MIALVLLIAVVGVIAADRMEQECAARGGETRLIGKIVHCEVPE